MKGKELTVSDKGQVEPVPQADNDGQVIAMWLHGRLRTTQRAYAYEVQGLLAAVGKPLVQITLGDRGISPPWNPCPRLPGPGPSMRSSPCSASPKGSATSISTRLPPFRGRRSRTPWPKESCRRPRFTDFLPWNPTPATEYCSGSCTPPGFG